MIPLTIFYLHIFAAIFIWVSQYQKQNFSSGFVSISFFILIFSVVWSICTYFSILFIEPQGFGLYFDRNVIGLVLTTLVEIGFYILFFKKPTLKQN